MTAEMSRLTPRRLHDDSASTEEMLRTEVEGLRLALSTRAAIEQAKGILMFLYQLDDAAAFAILQRWSMQENVKLRDMARALIDVSVHDHDARQDDEAHRAVRRALRRT